MKPIHCATDYTVVIGNQFIGGFDEDMFDIEFDEELSTKKTVDGNLIYSCIAGRHAEATLKIEQQSETNNTLTRLHIVSKETGAQYPVSIEHKSGRSYRSDSCMLMGLASESVAKESGVREWKLVMPSVQVDVPEVA